jgi:hypothetical protein
MADNNGVQMAEEPVERSAEDAAVAALMQRSKDSAAARQARKAAPAGAGVAARDMNQRPEQRPEAAPAAPAPKRDPQGAVYIDNFDRKWHKQETKLVKALIGRFNESRVDHRVVVQPQKRGGLYVRSDKKLMTRLANPDAQGLVRAIAGPQTTVRWHMSPAERRERNQELCARRVFAAATNGLPFEKEALAHALLESGVDLGAVKSMLPTQRRTSVIVEMLTEEDAQAVIGLGEITIREEGVASKVILRKFEPRPPNQRDPQQPPPERHQPARAAAAEAPAPGGQKPVQRPVEQQLPAQGSRFNVLLRNEPDDGEPADEAQDVQAPMEEDHKVAPPKAKRAAELEQAQPKRRLYVSVLDQSQDEAPSPAASPNQQKPRRQRRGRRQAEEARADSRRADRQVKAQPPAELIQQLVRAVQQLTDLLGPLMSAMGMAGRRAGRS